MTSGTVTVHMVSGQRLLLQKMMLYPAPILARAASARASAAKALGGTGMGVGVFGPIGLTLAAEAVALGVVSSMMASAANKAAAGSLQQAQAAFEKAKAKGRHFAIEDIAGLDIPDPAAWSGVGNSSDALVSIAGFSKEEKKQFCEKYGFKFGAFMDVNVVIPVPVPYAHSGEDFVFGMQGDGEIAFRWSQVEAFVPTRPQISPLAALQTAERKPVFVDWRSRIQD